MIGSKRELRPCCLSRFPWKSNRGHTNHSEVKESLEKNQNFSYAPIKSKRLKAVFYICCGDCDIKWLKKCYVDPAFIFLQYSINDEHK